MRISDWSSDVCSSDLQQDYRERDQEFDKEFVDGVRDVDRLIGNFDKMDTEWKRFVDFAFGHPQIFVQLEAIELGPHVDAQHKRGLPIIEYSKGGRLLVAPTYLSAVAAFPDLKRVVEGKRESVRDDF